MYKHITAACRTRYRSLRPTTSISVKFTFLNFAITSRDWSEENLFRNKKRPGWGSRKEKKREAPVPTRKFAHPNLCTLGGAVCKLLQVPLQGIRLLGQWPGLRGKRWRKGCLGIKQSLLSSKATFPLTSRHLWSSLLWGAERPTALFLFGNITVNKHNPASINDVQWQHTNSYGKGRLSSLSAGQAMLTDSQASLFFMPPSGASRGSKTFLFVREHIFILIFFFLAAMNEASPAAATSNGKSSQCLQGNGEA